MTQIPVRLSKIEELTGVPESTLRQAILAGELPGRKRAGAWHTSLEEYAEWIERGETQGEGRRDLAEAPERPLASRRAPERPGRRGPGEEDPAGSAPGAGRETEAPRKRRKRRQKPVATRKATRESPPPPAAANSAGGGWLQFMHSFGHRCRPMSLRFRALVVASCMPFPDGTGCGFCAWAPCG